ncbi:hypothetical protein A0H81_02897 [Grifola frondosa]|uniref:Uncharacterized protein n=1 Tax=Grifola frondosa TaxID=5627 RepID=A0A1C7ML96_GRIFR|nr:hypothetical protein A0H81_02897 [Grifola frondosa]
MKDSTNYRCRPLRGTRVQTASSAEAQNSIRGVHLPSYEASLPQPDCYFFLRNGGLKASLSAFMVSCCAFSTSTARVVNLSRRPWIAISSEASAKADAVEEASVGANAVEEMAAAAGWAGEEDPED